MSNVFYIQWLGGLIERGNLLLRSLQQGLSLSHNLSLGGRSWNTLTKLSQLLTTYLPTFDWHWWREFSTVIREIPRWHLLFNLFNIFFAKRQQILGVRNDSSINVHSNNSKNDVMNPKYLVGILSNWKRMIKDPGLTRISRFFLYSWVMTILG